MSQALVGDGTTSLNIRCESPGLLGEWATHFQGKAITDVRFDTVSHVWLERSAEKAYVIIGPPGTGKTTCATLFLKELRNYAQQQGVSCRTLHLGQSNAAVRAMYESVLRE